MASVIFGLIKSSLVVPVEAMILDIKGGFDTKAQ
jgi:hypothetical protein